VTAKLVMVTWHDAHSVVGSDYIESEHHQPCVMHTVGWLVKRDDAGITVACERYAHEGGWAWRQPTFIPAGMIQKVGKP